MLSHGKMRFLSLELAILRILDVFEALKLFFKVEDNCPTIIKILFSDPINEAYLLFVHGSLQIFQETILKLESDNLTGPEAALIYQNLITKLKNRKSEKFLPFLVKQKLLNLKREFEYDDTTFF